MLDLQLRWLRRSRALRRHRTPRVQSDVGCERPLLDTDGKFNASAMAFHVRSASRQV